MKHIRDEKEIFSKNRRPVGCEAFNFACHKEIECFTLCCRNVDIDLYPYDILRMKNHLGITSEEFLSKYTFTVFKDNPNFPNVKLRLMDDDTKRCPFLTEDGCGIYRDRPDACRTYPLERAVSLAPFNLPMRREFYFLVQQPICKGHFEEKKWTVKQWIEDQELKPFNDMNDLWVEVDIL
ncbi:MAG: YkgJ family cysteine cluster protein, partial [Nitrospirae bacterium]